MSDYNIFTDPEKFVLLWVHESERVYGDRLVDLDDLVKFKSIVQNQVKKSFVQFNIARFYLPGTGIKPDNLIFCHFADGTTQAEDLTYDRGSVWPFIFMLSCVSIMYILYGYLSYS